EKRILEEEKELAARFLTALQNKIEEVSADFKDDIHLPGSIKDSLIKTTSRYDFITLPFILKNDGSFHYPNFIGIPENQPDPKFSNKFKSAFKKGEEAEFAKIDLETTQEYYLSCLSYSSEAGDSLKALNALGRVSVKLNNYEDALAHYSLIIADYFHIISENGLPYAYYAIPQLIKITDPDNCEKILSVVEFCLEKMEMGAIPLNFNTEELLILITKWSEENIFNNREQLSHINTLTKSIEQQLQFINEYGNELLEIAKKGTWDDHLTVGNDFKVLNSFSGRDQELLLINTNFKDHAGFLIDREKLFDTIIKTDLQFGFEFDYKIKFLSTYNLNTSGHDLTYSSQLNPYFSGYILQIEPNDENLIKEFIKRRSWIYGIALVLLVFAMFLGVALILRDITRE
ncbi:MAG: hypothetical protein KAU44_00020, partial [Candidatus Marinimicrobia bacterium]|nr:hypothetical protein [Candidatus Neomarinimicrobiota bacterium]